MLLQILALAALLASAASLNPMASTLEPLRGWSTWNTFGCYINQTLVEESIDALAASPLRGAGYEWVLIDDCWTTCLKYDPSDGSCLQPGPRGADGKIQTDPQKFPAGFAQLTARAHDKGLKIGIYTSVSAVTCGGYTGSLHHEALDAETFVQDWGFDLVKHDTCGVDYSVHDGGLQNATVRMRDGLWAAGGGQTVYYLDGGNPTSPQRLFNPHQRHVVYDEALAKLATSPDELAWVWTSRLDAADGKGPHMLKTWFDRDDTWVSVLTNAHNQARIAEYHRRGHYLFPDMLTLGMGGQTEAEYRTQFFLWAILGSPLVMGNDIRSMDAFTVDLATSPELLRVQNDSDCVQGTLLHSWDATEAWARPLADGSFAAVLLNKGSSYANATLSFDGDWHDQQDFYPASFPRAAVRDLHAGKDLGTFDHAFTTALPPHDAVILRITPA